jgi:hypothetical protein
MLLLHRGFFSRGTRSAGTISACRAAVNWKFVEVQRENRVNPNALRCGMESLLRAA